jgi:hypothetical protein
MYVIDPVHYNVVVEALPEVMQRIQLVDPDKQLPAWVPKDGRGVIALTDQMATDGIPADGGARGKGGAVLTLLVGRVLWVGPGKQWEGAFVTPNLSPGEMVLFSPRTVSYEFSLHGRSIKIVPWSEISGKVREVERDSFEWQALVALSPDKDRLGQRPPPSAP